MADKSYRVRLSTDVVPEEYNLHLEPDLVRHVFKGSVKITCNVHVATETITVNTKQLLISSAKFKPEDGAEMQANGIYTKVKEMTTAFEFEDVLPVGKGVLEIEFQGTLNDQMAGFYRSKYKDSKGQEKYMGVTQFEAIDARRAFPCWDEPGVKAVFIVTIVFPSYCTCLSNMPTSKCITLADGRICETFMPTPKMSTYLLAFCVGEYEFIAGQTKDGTLARVFCTPGNVAQCDFALKCTVQALDFYNEFFGIPYPLPKVDMIAIPDFSAGAMENWGLVTYREAAMLCNEETVSAVLKERICTVVAHELAHQWFGNLVTMEWWDDLWLNEGFANWMQNFCADKLFPEWNIWETFVATIQQQQALILDGMRSSHPIQVPIGKAESVEEVFDAISYCKGGSVVRMIYSVLGEKDFQAGLKLYFQRHQYGNTETNDLWQAWTEASGKPISKMMSSWTTRMGYPVLKVLSDPIDAGSDEVEVEQQWFLADGSEKPGDSEVTWFIPVHVGSDKKRSAEVAFMEAQKKAKISLGGCAKDASWLKLNFGQHVPCRVLYPPTLMGKLAAKIMELPVVDKIGLVADTYALCKNGSADAASMAKLLGSFKDERNDKVWTVLAGCLGGMRRVMIGGLSQGVSDAFQKFVGALIYPAFKDVGWDTKDADGDNEKKLRSTMVGLISSFFDSAAMSDIAAEAQKRCEAFLDNPVDATLNPDVRSAVLSIAMEASGSQALYDRLVAAHNKTNDNTTKKDIYSALSAAKSTALTEQFLEWSLTDDVRAQDLIYVPMNVVGKRGGGDLVFGWCQKHYDRIYARLGETSMMLFMHIVKLSGRGFVTEEKAAEVETFWRAQKVLEKIEKALTQTVEGIHTEAKFLARLKGTDVDNASFWTDLAGKL